MNTVTQQNSTVEQGIACLLRDAANAELDALPLLDRGLRGSLLRKSGSHATDRILSPLEIEALSWTVKFGWVRWWMLARLMWSTSPATSARTLANRMILRLVSDKLIYEVGAGDGQNVFLLAERGAAYLRTYFPDLYGRDVSAGRPGLTSGRRQTSATGATFLHRLLSNAYLCDAVASGRSIATEYEQLADAAAWQVAWRHVDYRAKRPDGLTAMLRPMSLDGVALNDIEVVETLCNRPKVSPTRNAAGQPVLQDGMGRLLVSLREHAANNQRVAIVLKDDAVGRGIGKTVARYARERGIQVSPDHVQFVYVDLKPGKPILGPFRRVPWSEHRASVASGTKSGHSGGQGLPVLPAPPMAIAPADTSSDTPARPPATKPSPDAPATAPLAAHREFRILIDKHYADGEREIVIQHVTSGTTARASTFGSVNRGYLEFEFFGPDDEPLYLDSVVRHDNLDLGDAMQLDDLHCELRQAVI